MKRATCSLVIATSLTLAGCGEKPSTQAPTPVAKPPVAAKPVETTPPPPPGVAAPQAPAAPAAETGEAVKIDLNAISLALQQYVAANQMNPSKLTEQDLQNLVKGKWLPYLPPPPAGKKYVWNNMLQVSLANK